MNKKDYAELMTELELLNSAVPEDAIVFGIEPSRHLELQIERLRDEISSRNRQLETLILLYQIQLKDKAND